MANPLPDSCKTLHKELANYLKKIVSESSTLVKNLNPREKNTTAEELTILLSEGVANRSTLPPRRKSLTKSMVVGQLFNHTFAISKDSIVFKVNMNELPILEGKINHKHHFTFNDRLKGWNIECRQREDTKMRDMFYHHLGSNKKFRSILEVVNFILYEIYPTTQRKSKVQETLDDETMMAESSTRKRKKKSTLSNDGKKVQHLNMTKEDVVKFMTDAFKIFQDGAYEKELAMKKDFKYSDYFIFSNTKNKFDSFFKENQQRKNVEKSKVEQENGVTRNSISSSYNMTIAQDIMKAPKIDGIEIEIDGNEVHQTKMEAKNSSKKVDENSQVTQFDGQEIQPDTIIGDVLPKNTIESLEEDSQMSMEEAIAIVENLLASV